MYYLIILNLNIFQKLYVKHYLCVNIMYVFFVSPFAYVHLKNFLVMPYRVVVFPSRKLSASTTSANAWIIVAGTLGETKLIPLPRQTLEIVFQVSFLKCAFLFILATLTEISFALLIFALLIFAFFSLFIL